MVRKARAIIWFLVLIGIMFLGLFDPGQPPVLAQQPTGKIPTVTGTPEGPVVKVDQSFAVIHVFAGPSIYEYPSIGVLLGNETAPAIGRARDREDWIQIRYPGVPGSIGWVWSLYVSLSPGARLPLVDIPGTPTPFATPTINPTLEAAFIGQQTPTRLPTFTPPAPLDVPLFNDASGSSTTGIPTGLLIVSLGLFGLLGAVISYLRGR
ncbi:MAG: SH3 domain-containing protein [Chloroflexi bacterium]|nr:MAG: SH3 domain-containing protein [Chloroflexota bacterium]